MVAKFTLVLEPEGNSQMHSTHKYLIGLITLIALVSMRSANAYLDPGTGSMIVQGLIAAVVGAAVVLGVYCTKIKRFFYRIFLGKKDTLPKSRSEDSG